MFHLDKVVTEEYKDIEREEEGIVRGKEENENKKERERMKERETIDLWGSDGLVHIESVHYRISLTADQTDDRVNGEW